MGGKRCGKQKGLQHHRHGHPIVLFKITLNFRVKNFINKKLCPILNVSGNAYDEMLFLDLFHFEENRTTFN